MQQYVIGTFRRKRYYCYLLNLFVLIYAKCFLHVRYIAAIHIHVSAVRASQMMARFVFLFTFLYGPGQKDGHALRTVIVYAAANGSPNLRVCVRLAYDILIAKAIWLLCPLLYFYHCHSHTTGGKTAASEYIQMDIQHAGMRPRQIYPRYVSLEPILLNEAETLFECRRSAGACTYEQIVVLRGGNLNRLPRDFLWLYSHILSQLYTYTSKSGWMMVTCRKQRYFLSVYLDK